jgi:hypothetical protein
MIIDDSFQARARERYAYRTDCKPLAAALSACFTQAPA